MKSSVYYGLNRTASLLKVFEFLCKTKLSRSMSAGGLVDFAFTSIVAKHGKMKRLTIPFSLREYSLSVNVVGTRPELLLDPDLPVFFRELLQELMKESEGAHLEAKKALTCSFAEDFSCQLRYDLTNSVSKRAMVRYFPIIIQEAAELGIRYLQAAQGFRRKGYLPALSLFNNEEYSMFKKQLQKYPL